MGKRAGEGEFRVDSVNLDSVRSGTEVGMGKSVFYVGWLEKDS